MGNRKRIVLKQQVDIIRVKQLYLWFIFRIKLRGIEIKHRRFVHFRIFNFQIRLRHYLAHKLRIAYGEKILPAYYEQNIDSWNRIALTERTIRNIEIEGVPVKGNLDKIEFEGKQVTVVDYKTGKVKNAKKKFNRPNDELPNGGDYWRQAVFYKLLVDNDRTNDWQVANTVFDFVEPDKDGNYYKEKIVITPEDMETVTEQITSVYAKIMAHDFNTGCGKQECDWCHFVKSNFKQVEGVMVPEDAGE